MVDTPNVGVRPLRSREPTIVLFWPPNLFIAKWIWKSLIQFFISFQIVLTRAVSDPIESMTVPKSSH